MVVVVMVVVVVVVVLVVVGTQGSSCSQAEDFGGLWTRACGLWEEQWIDKNTGGATVHQGVEEIKIDAVLVRAAGGTQPTHRQQLMGRRVVCEPQPGGV